MVNAAATPAGDCTDPAQVDAPIPPAALLRRYPGEPTRADLHWPPQPRGTGEAWPADAKLELNETPGRFPLAYAWPMLAAGKEWTRKHGGRLSAVTPAEAMVVAIEATLKEACPRESPRAAREPVVLVTPNALSDSGQQDLIDAGRARSMDLHLLPRAMAAAMAWCRRFEGELDSDRAESGKPLGAILVIHFGLDQWELAVVDVVAVREGERFRCVPVRRRKVLDAVPSYGIELMHRLAIRSLEMSYQQVSAARVWELVWCTPWMKPALATLGDHAEPFTPVVNLARHARSSEFLKQQCRQATQRIFRTTEPVPGLLRDVLPKLPQFTELRDWFEARRKEAPREGYLGAVLTGPMAGIPFDKEIVGPHHLAKVWPQPKRVLMEGVELPRGFMAQSATTHAACVALSQRDAPSAQHTPSDDVLPVNDAAQDVATNHSLAQEAAENPATPSARAATRRTMSTYLSTLPRLRMAGNAGGKPAWVDLFDGAGKLLPGGIAQHRASPLTGLPIKADATKFRIALMCDDWPTVRIASAVLPQPLMDAEQVELRVSAATEQGFPCIELVPQREGTLGQAKVCVNFRTMKDTGKSPDEFLRGLSA